MKRLAIVMIFLSLGYLVSAQGIAVGVKFGPSLAKLVGSDAASSNKMKTGFMFGAFGEYSITDMISAQVELNYESKGTKVKMTNYNNLGVAISTSNIKSGLSYLSIPILAKATFEVGPVNVYGNIGPYFGFLMRATFDGDTETSYTVTTFNQFGQAVTTTVTNKYKDNFKTFDIGLAWGGGALYDLSSLMEGLSVLADLRLNHGFMNIPDASNNNKVKNFSFVFAVGAAYKLGN